MVNGVQPVKIKDWLNTGIYGVFGFLLIFGFNKLDRALLDIHILEGEQKLLRYQVKEQSIHISIIQSKIYKIEQE